MSAFRVGAVKSILQLNISEFRQGMQEAAREVGNFKRTGESLKASMMEIGKTAGLVGGSITAAFGLMVRNAARAEESANLFKESMGSMADATREWSYELSSAIGVSSGAIRDVVGNFNVVIANMGFTQEAAAGLSKEFTKLAFDMSSFYNIGHEEALAKLRSGILGESEPLKQLGIVLSETAVQAYAFQNGIASIGEELTNSQKVVARYGLIMEQTRTAQGDLARTVDSLTNQSRRLTDQLSELSTVTGDQLKPALTEVVTRVNNAVRNFIDWARANQDVYGQLVKVAAGTGVALSAVGSLTLGVAALSRGFNLMRNAAAVAWAVAAAPVTILVVKIAAVGTAIYTLRAVWKQNFDEMGAKTDWLIEKMEGLASKARGFFTGAGNALANLARGASQMTTDYLGIDRDALNERASGTFSRVTAELIEGAEIAWGKIKGVFSSGAKAVGDQFKEDVGEDMVALFERITGALGDVDFEGYADIEEMIKNAMADANDLAVNTREAGSAAKKAADEFKRMAEEATDLRLSVFPEEAFAEETRRITELAALFPETLTDEAVARAFQQTMDDFKARGVDAIKVLESGLLELPDRFEPAMREAGLRAGIAAREKLMEGLARSEDEKTFSQIERGRELADSLTGAEIVSRMATDIEDIKAAGRMDMETGNLLARDYWDELAGISSETFDTILTRVMDLAPAMVPELERIREALRFDTAVQAINQVGKAAAELGSALAEVGVKGIGRVVSGFASAIRSATGVADSIKKAKDAFKALSEGGEGATKNLLKGIGGVLDAIALTATAVIELGKIFGLFGEEGQKELKGMAKVVDELKDAMDNFVDAITDHLLEFVKTGQLAFRDLIEYITDEIFRITVSNLVVSPLLDLGVGLLGFKDGGAFNKGHVVDSPEVFGTKSGLAVRGEAGTEVVMPAIRLADGTLGVKSVGGGGGGTVVQIIDQRSADQPPIEVRETRGPDGQAVHQIIVRSVQAALIQGDLDRELSLIGPRLR